MQTYSDPTRAGGSTAQEPSTTERAKEQAQQAAGQARSTLHSQVDERSTEAGLKVGGFASDVRSVGEQVREQGMEQPAKLADQAAERAERLGTYLTESDGDRILGDVEDFGRRRPWAVIAGGLTVGLVASRFLKAASSRRYQQRWTRHEPAPRPHARSRRTTSGIHATPVRSGPPSIDGSVSAP